ncbi:hypothetical protein DR192_04890 [Lawsonia intracellularis]|uniref:AMIN domain-containing protein n=1 Tax=Lawsonia intracellularis TaxID=29546 RepID=UPI000DE57841|nr:AMIN domain-containing protein [Lawsonia intracellularis]RBN33857.1 hypothetical protein DR192_04890 [Lawsonia intracellularis]
MFRMIVFFTVGIIMLILACLAALEFIQDFPNSYQEDGQMVTGIISKIIGSNCDNSSTSDINNKKSIDRDKDTLLSSSNRNTIQAGTPHQENNIKEDLQLTNKNEQTTPEEEEEEESKFIWLTEAPSELKKGEKAITQTRLSIGKDISFRITADDAIKAQSMMLKNPDRFVLDLQGKWGISLPPIPPTNPWLKKIRLGTNNGNTRLVFDLQKKPSKTEIKQLDTNKIEIQIH